MKSLGIDEAGRGAIVSNLVIAGAVFTEENLEKLKKLGVKDSKLLTPKKRSEFYQQIIDLCEAFEIISVSPQEIDAALDSDSTNLNWLEADKTTDIINKLKPHKAIIDCPSPNISAYRDYLLSRLEQKTELVVEHKADLNHIECSAASILAKVTRDSTILDLQKQLNIDFGSGYPSDPKTKIFVKKYCNKYPDLFRKTWQPFKDIIKSNSQSKLTKF